MKTVSTILLVKYRDENTIICIFYVQDLHQNGTNPLNARLETLLTSYQKQVVNIFNFYCSSLV